jgi:hypothetical protein
MRLGSFFSALGGIKNTVKNALGHHDRCVILLGVIDLTLALSSKKS